MDFFNNHKKLIISVGSVLIGLIVLGNFISTYIAISSNMTDTSNAQPIGEFLGNAFTLMAILMVVAAMIFVIRKVLQAGQDVQELSGEKKGEATSEWIEKEDGTFVRVDAYSSDSEASQNASTLQKAEKVADKSRDFTTMLMGIVVSFAFGGFGAYAMYMAPTQADAQTITIVGGMFLAFGIFNLVRSIKPMIKK